MFEVHRGKIINEVGKCKVDGFLVTSGADRFYLTGLELEGFWLLVTDSRIIALSNQMLACQLEAALGKGVEVLDDEDSLAGLKKTIKKYGLERIGFDSKSINVSSYDFFRNELKKTAFVKMPDFVRKIRQVKTAREIEIIRQSCRITVNAYRKIKPCLNRELTEKKLADRIADNFREDNAECAFPSIVASGVNSAYPHYITSDDTIDSSGILLVDMGCRSKGYCSDLTRTVFLDGRSSAEKNRVLRKIYSIVKYAQGCAVEKVKPGVTAAEIDSIPRKIFKKYGYNKYFIHSTGHGVGIEIHELPSVSAKSDTVLSQGMVLTVEPGIYIPGTGGVRIEDTVLVTNSGCEVLTND